MSAAIPAADGFALAMVVILATSFAVVLLLLLSIVRHGARRNREVERLLEEIEQQSRAPQPPRQPAGEPPQDKAAPWERPADWWKR